MKYEDLCKWDVVEYNGYGAYIVDGSNREDVGISVFYPSGEQKILYVSPDELHATAAANTMDCNWITSKFFTNCTQHPLSTRDFLGYHNDWLFQVQHIENCIALKSVNDANHGLVKHLQQFFVEMFELWKSEGICVHINYYVDGARLLITLHFFKVVK